MHIDTKKSSKVGFAALGRERGFTVIELMIVLVIASIVISVAIPSFNAMISSNAIASQTNHFSSAVSLARSEAIKRNVSVMVCKRSGATCSTSAQWENGWIIFADNDADESLDSGEEIRFIEALKNNYTLRPSISNLNWLSFQSDGKVEVNTGTFSGVTFRLCGPDADNTESRAVAFNVIGQARLSKGTASCP